MPAEIEMPHDELDQESDMHALVQSVHEELRADFLRTMPGRVATLERIARSLLETPGDDRGIHMLHAEAHQLAGTTAVYGMLRTSAVVKQFDQSLRERVATGNLTLCPILLQSFLTDLNAAIMADT